jgi:rhodanese-related sulfurtransferase
MTPFALNDPAKAREFFMAKLQFTTGPVELERGLRENKATINVIDVRAAEDYAKGHIPGAFNLPKERWSTYEGLRKDKLNVVYCYSQTCHLAATAAIEFASKGYPVMELEGGFGGWKAAEFKIEKGAFVAEARKAA